MNKILYYLLVFSLLGLLGCDYKPVLSKKNYLNLYLHFQQYLLFPHFQENNKFCLF